MTSRGVEEPQHEVYALPRGKEETQSIWLVDVATEFSYEGHYVGFDLSDSQFPTPSSLPQGCSLEFKVHDMTKRFPPEYHAQFDLVNIRLVVQALKAFISLKLKGKEPGGYIQWGDVNWNEVKSVPSNTELDMLDEIITGHMKYHGLSST
ncbi:hypothetical protein N7509_010030 [Penicillium cosmopolitanum]|uniref:Methyltransferase domain-containing protein n=1 Tax=Penicillium cosmopolitanum TaxID=1131564 RepID=A0A9W9VQP5_9EURO|nr:uncharacterized protein N7509_010030 [Penicillium cosmopolitanum]KAJ5387489.1 hypothetical protein N7509_010030 [Penicillium cosmopolitanum]